MATRVIRQALIFLPLLLAGACGKTDEPVSPYIDTDIPVITGYLNEIIDSVHFSSSDGLFEYAARAIENMDVFFPKEIMDLMYLQNKTELGLRNYIDVGVNPDGTSKLHFELCNFTYRTVDVHGNPIMLSGSVAFPNNSDEERSYELNDITLYSSHYLLPHTLSPTENGSPAMLRVMFNNMVVMPELQGNGGSYGQVETADIVADVVARQSIDCELAALELVGKLGLKMGRDYGTYNMGASKGAFTAMAVQRALETTEVPDIRKAVNLKSSYCGCGPYDLSGALEYYCRMGGEMNFPWFVPVAVKNVFDSYRELFVGYGLPDFFTDSFNDAYTLLEAAVSQEFSWEELNSLFFEYGFTNIKSILNGRMFDASGMPDRKDSLYSLFDKCLQANNPACGWKPGVPVLIAASPGDDFVPYGTTRKTYEQLAVGDMGIPNENVIWKEMTDNVGHIAAAELCLIDMLMYRNPALQLEPFQ